MTPLYAFAYQIAPPLDEVDVGGIAAWVEELGTRARALQRSWAARVVQQPEMTRVLVVTDVIDPDDVINVQLETELVRRGSTFSMTVPMRVEGPGSGTS